MDNQTQQPNQQDEKKPEENKNQVEKIGTKGVFLHDMFKAKVLVPPGFIIVTAYQEFMEKTGLFSKIETAMNAHNASLDDMDSILQASNEIVKMINEVEFPKDLADKILKEFGKLKAEYVAVRASVIVDESSSFFPDQEITSQLNIDNKNLIKAIKKLWVSFFSPAAIIYRLKQKIDIKKPLAVLLIQKMVNAESSGVCFTSHPIGRDPRQVVIEASLGYSQEVNVMGIARDTYVVNKSDWKILGKSVLPQEKMLARVGASTKEVDVGEAVKATQKLNDSQIITLAKLAKHIDDFYKNVPQKIEWALESGRFYVLESRPIDKA
jgi:pyruvate,water dikinase